MYFKHVLYDCYYIFRTYVSFKHVLYDCSYIFLTYVSLSMSYMIVTISFIPMCLLSMSCTIVTISFLPMCLLSMSCTIVTISFLPMCLYASLSSQYSILTILLSVRLTSLCYELISISKLFFTSLLVLVTCLSYLFRYQSFNHL